MSDLNDRVNQLADYSWLKLVARISLPVIAFVGMSAWNDLKEQSGKINAILQNQAKQEQALTDIGRRVDDLEDWQKQITYRGASQ